MKISATDYVFNCALGTQRKFTKDSDNKNAKYTNDTNFVYFQPTLYALDAPMNVWDTDLSKLANFLRGQEFGGYNMSTVTSDFMYSVALRVYEYGTQKLISCDIASDLKIGTPFLNKAFAVPEAVHNRRHYSGFAFSLPKFDKHKKYVLEFKEIWSFNNSANLTSGNITRVFDSIIENDDDFDGRGFKFAVKSNHDVRFKMFNDISYYGKAPHTHYIDDALFDANPNFEITKIGDSIGAGSFALSHNYVPAIMVDFNNGYAFEKYWGLESELISAFNKIDAANHVPGNFAAIKKASGDNWDIVRDILAANTGVITRMRRRFDDKSDSVNFVCYADELMRIIDDKIAASDLSSEEAQALKAAVRSIPPYKYAACMGQPMEFTYTGSDLRDLIPGIKIKY